MNSMYLIIILGVVLLVFFIIGYYLYQESKFRKMVESTFNQKTDDILMHGNKKIVFEGENRNLTIKFDEEIIKKDKAVEDSVIIEKDIIGSENAPVVDKSFDNSMLSFDQVTTKSEIINESKIKSVHNIFADEVVEEIIPKIEMSIEKTAEEVHIPEDSMEAFFAKFDKIEFQFVSRVHRSLDLVIDVVFEDVLKIKSLCDIAQFTEKSFAFYILDKNNQWSKFESGKKYAINGLKLVVELVDRDGIINQAQILNIYNTLYKFVLDNHGHIRVSNYEHDIENIKNIVNHIEDVELDLSLYLVCKEHLRYRDLAAYLTQHNFILRDGRFACIDANAETVFELSDEHGRAFDVSSDYKLLTITSKMHLQQIPAATIDKIFDFAETFMGTFESRILTTNKLIFGEKEYKALTDYVADYVSDSQKYGIELGGALLRRVC